MAGLPRPCSLPAFPRSLVKAPLPSLTAKSRRSFTDGFFRVRGQYRESNYRNGDIIHLEGTLQQFLPLGSKITLLGIGAVTLSSNYKAIEIKKGLF